MAKKKTKLKSQKKVVSKKTTLKKANPETYFFAVDGAVIKDMFELANALNKMSKDAFYHHVNEMKNDFSNWVNDVLEEGELAKKILKEKTPEKIEIVVLRHMLKKK